MADDEEVGTYRRILRMVAELHVRGYQRLRIAPGMSSSGCHWRCAIAPVGNILRSHGARLRSFEVDVVRYTSGMGSRYFDWDDAPGKTPSKLADLFLRRFPDVSCKGNGPDWPYAGWYVEMLHLTYPDFLPIAYADYLIDEDCLPTVSLLDRSVRVPLPPPGEAADPDE